MYQGSYVMSDQTRHGFGAMIWFDGRKYLGGFRWGKPSGSGMHWTDYDEVYYEGQVWGSRRLPAGVGVHARPKYRRRGASGECVSVDRSWPVAHGTVDGCSKSSVFLMAGALAQFLVPDRGGGRGKAFFWA